MIRVSAVIKFASWCCFAAVLHAAIHSYVACSSAADLGDADVATSAQPATCCWSSFSFFFFRSGFLFFSLTKLLN